VHLREIGQLLERMRVAEGDVEHTVVRERRQRRDRGGFLASSVAGRGDEDASVFSGELTCSPEGAGGVPESLSSDWRFPVSYYSWSKEFSCIPSTERGSCRIA
jgi:hypothetical protein